MEMTTDLTPADTIIAEASDYRVRTLLPEEFVSRAHEFPHYPLGLPDPNHSVVVVVEETATGTIVASMMLLTAPMLEGLYIRAEERGKQTTIHGLLWGGMLSMLSVLNIPHPLTIMETPAMLALARKAGFVPVAGTLLKLE